MATTLTSIHRANDSNGFNVSFQLDHTIGEKYTVFQVFYSSPGQSRNIEIDVPLSELPELIKSMQQILDETPPQDKWCSTCKGSGELITELTSSVILCPDCAGRGIPS